MSALGLKLKVHQGRSRRDVVSESQLKCQLCSVTGRIRDIRTHLKNKHQLDSYFMCMDSECNFVCSVNFSCFTIHAIRFHEEYFQGRRTNLDRERLFKLCTLNAKIKPNKHSRWCLEESEIENKKKKQQIRRRNTAEKRILSKFSKITSSVRLNVNLAYKLYEEVIDDYETLKIEFPRTQIRNLASAFDRKLLAFLDIYEEFNQKHPFDQ